MIVDDHAVVGSGLATFFLASDDLEFVGEAGSGAGTGHPQADVVLMLLVMSEMDGATATEPLYPKHLQTVVIELTSSCEEETVRGALRDGAWPLPDPARARSPVADGTGSWTTTRLRNG